MSSEPRICVILKRHSMTALKEDTSLSSKFGLFYPLLSPQIKNNINSNYIDDYSYVDILKLESGLILLIH